MGCRVHRTPWPPRGEAAFTLVEMLVSMTILVMIMGIIASATSMVSKTWKSASGQASSFQKARAGFATLTQICSQATLNTYWDYVDASGNPRTAANMDSFVPFGYKRASDLHFVSGQALSLVPGGGSGTTQGHALFFPSVLGRSADAVYQPLKASLNSFGFFIQFSDDKSDWPDFIANNFMAQNGNYRFRLMQWVPQTQNMHIYDSTAVSSYNADWFSRNYLPSIGTPATAPQESARVLAENVTLLVILPRLTAGDETALSGSSSGTLLCPNYQYDSRSWCPGYSGGISNGTYKLRELMRNQLPPLIDVVMVAVSDRDAERLQARYGSSMPDELKIPEGTNAHGNPYFQNSADLATDIQAYEAQLTNSHISFKTFWSTVTMNNAKWSAN